MRRFAPHLRPTPFPLPQAEAGDGVAWFDQFSTTHTQWYASPHKRRWYWPYRNRHDQRFWYVITSTPQPDNDPRTTLVGIDHKTRFYELLLVNGALACVLSVSYITLFFGILRMLPNLTPYNSHVFTTIIIAFGSFPLHRQLEKLVRRFLRRDWQAAQDLVREITAGLGHTIDIDAINDRLTNDLPQRLGFQGATLWLLDPSDERCFVAIGAPTNSLGAELLIGGATIRLLNNVPNYLLTPPEYAEPVALPFRSQGAVLLIPLRINKHLIGIYGCGAPLNGNRYPAHVVELLLTLAPALAAALENARAYARIAALNQQLEYIDQLKNEFIESIAHELRTPLTSLSLATQLLCQYPGMIDELNTVLNDNVNRLQRQIERSLFLDIDSDSEQVVLCSRVELAPLLDSVLEPFMPTMQPLKRTITHSVSPGLCAWAAPERLRRAIHEIVDNAVRYGGSGNINLVAHYWDELAVIQICDQGSGIPEEEQPRLFAPFYRGQKTRSLAATPGMGVGLSIARHELAAINGRVWLERTGPDGTVVTITIPAMVQTIVEQERAVGA